MSQDFTTEMGGFSNQVSTFARIEGIYHMADGECRVMMLIEGPSQQERMGVPPGNLRMFSLSIPETFLKVMKMCQNCLR